MANNSVYYDTCVFEVSLNAAHPEYAASRAVLDYNQISWTVCICTEISANEATIREFIEKCEIIWAANGINFLRVTLKMAKETQKTFLALKRNLKQLGLDGNDWNHLMAACSAEAEVLCSTDDDFWDPRNKRNRHQARRSDRVKRIIENELQLLIRSPSDVIAS